MGTLNYYEEEEIKDVFKDILKSKEADKSKYEKIVAFVNGAPQDYKLYEKFVAYFRKSIFSREVYKKLLSLEYKKKLYKYLIVLHVRTANIKSPVEGKRLIEYYKKNAQYYDLTKTEVEGQIATETSRGLPAKAGAPSTSPVTPQGAETLTADRGTGITKTDTATQEYLDCLKKDTVTPIDEDTRVLLKDIEDFISDIDTKLDIFLLKKSIIELEATVDKLTQPKSTSWSEVIFEITFSIIIPGGIVGFFGGYLGGKIILKLGKTVADSPWGRALTDAGKDAFKQGIKTIITEVKSYKSEESYKRSEEPDKRSQIIYKITEGIKRTAQIQKCAVVNGMIKKDSFGKIRNEYLLKRQYFNNQKENMNDWLTNEFDSAYLCNICIPGQAIIEQTGTGMYMCYKEIPMQKDEIGSINASIPEIKSLKWVLNSFYNFFNDISIAEDLEFDHWNGLVGHYTFMKAIQSIKTVSPMIYWLLGNNFVINPDDDIDVRFTILKDITDQHYFAVIQSSLNSKGSPQVSFWYLGHLPPLGEQMTIYLYKEKFRSAEPLNVYAKQVLSTSNYKDFETGSKKQKLIRETLINYLNSGTTTK